MKKFFFLICFCTFILLTNCIPVSDEIPTSSPLADHPTTINSPISQGAPTAMPTSLELTTPAAISSPISSNPLVYHCLDIAPNLPSDARPKGMLVFSGKHSFLLDLQTNAIRDLNYDQGNFSVSPNGEWLASYFVDHSTEPTATWLLIEKANGEQQNRILWEKNWYLLGGWLDNEHIWISRIDDPLIVVVNPFTGQQWEPPADFPGIQTMAQLGAHFVFGASSIVYSSSLNQAVYPRLESDGYVYYVLWDQQARRILAKIRGFGKPGSPEAIWSPDEKQVFISVFSHWDNKLGDEVDELFSLGVNGRVTQLTNFGSSFSNAEITGASLSPDGRKISFWLRSRPSSFDEPQLTILDIDTHMVTNYCIPGSSQGLGSSPVWSPDSHYLAVESTYKPNASQVILVDTIQNWAAQISENVTPVGWMIGTATPLP